MKKVVGSMSDWSGVLKDLFRQIDDKSLTLENLQALLEHNNPFEVCNVGNKNLIRDWEKFYSGLGIKCDFSKVVIPDDPGGFERVIIMAQGVAPQWAYDKCKNLFECSKWTDKNLDEMVISDRNAKNGPYAIRVRDLIEADEELKNMPANNIKKEKIITETLEERLIHELKFFKETGKHLDIKNITHITLCSGSRVSVDGVPSVFWDENYGGLRVYWVYFGSASVNLRARRAVFCI